MRNLVSRSSLKRNKLLARWDFGTDLENDAAALGTCVLLAAERDDDRSDHSGQQIAELLGGCVAKLMAAFDRIDPPWGEVNRHVRGELNLPVAGGPDILRAIYGRGLEENGYLTNVAGDGLYYLVSWEADGTQKVQGIHQFGSATLDEASPHYADQADDYAKEILHDPLFAEDALSANLAREYRPGEE